MVKIIGLWSLTSILFVATVATPDPWGVVVGTTCGASLGLSICITAVTLKERA